MSNSSKSGLVSFGTIDWNPEIEDGMYSQEEFDKASDMLEKQIESLAKNMNFFTLIPSGYRYKILLDPQEIEETMDGDQMEEFNEKIFAELYHFLSTIYKIAIHATQFYFDGRINYEIKQDGWEIYGIIHPVFYELAHIYYMVTPHSEGFPETIIKRMDLTNDNN